MTTKLKVKIVPRFLADALATSPILLNKAGAIFTFSLDINALLTTLRNYFLSNTLLAEPIVVTASSASVDATTAAIAVSRAAPSTTAISLPAVAGRNGLPLRVADWSTSVTDHTITLTPNGAETIMGAASFPIHSNATQNGGVTLYPSSTLSGWYIAP